jgi:hypothetical protein
MLRSCPYNFISSLLKCWSPQPGAPTKSRLFFNNVQPIGVGAGVLGGIGWWGASSAG